MVGRKKYTVICQASLKSKFSKAKKLAHFVSTIPHFLSSKSAQYLREPGNVEGGMLSSQRSLVETQPDWRSKAVHPSTRSRSVIKNCENRTLSGFHFMPLERHHGHLAQSSGSRDVRDRAA